MLHQLNKKKISLRYLPSSGCQWPLRRGTVDNELHHSQCCQKPPLHHHLETETRKTVLDRTDAQTLRTFQMKMLKFLTSPTNISYISTPSPHQSTARVYDVSVRTSGARNSGVPQNVLVRSPKPIPGKETKTGLTNAPDCIKHNQKQMKEREKEETLPSLHNPKSAIFT